MGTEGRFSDEKLNAFYKDFQEVQREFYSLMCDVREHMSKEEQKWEELNRTTEANSVILESQLQATARLAEVIELYDTGRAGLKIARWVSKFAIWLTSIGGLAAIGHFLLEHIYGGRPPP